MLELLWALNDNPQTFSNRYGRELEGLMGQPSASFTGAAIGVKAALARQARELTALPVVEAARRASVCTRRACGLLWGTTTPRHIG